MKKRRVYVRKLDGLYYAVLELIQKGKEEVTIEELEELVSRKITEKVLKRKKKNSKTVSWGKTRYRKSMILVGKLAGLLEEKDGKIIVKMPKKSLEELKREVKKEIRKHGTFRRWLDKKMIEEVVRYTGKKELTVSEFIDALIKTGWIYGEAPPKLFLRRVNAMLSRLKKARLIVVHDGKVKVRKGVVK